MDERNLIFIKQEMEDVNFASESENDDMGSYMQIKDNVEFIQAEMCDVKNKDANNDVNKPLHLRLKSQLMKKLELSAPLEQPDNEQLIRESLSALKPILPRRRRNGKSPRPSRKKESDRKQSANALETIVQTNESADKTNERIQKTNQIKETMHKTNEVTELMRKTNAIIAKMRKTNEDIDRMRKTNEIAETKRKANEATAAMRRRTSEINEAKRKTNEIRETKRKTNDVTTEAMRRRTNETKETIRKTNEIREAKLKTNDVTTEAMRRRTNETKETLRKTNENTETKRKTNADTETIHKTGDLAEAIRKTNESKEAMRKATESKEAMRKATESKEAMRKTTENREAMRKTNDLEEAIRKTNEIKELLCKTNDVELRTSGCVITKQNSSSIDVDGTPQRCKLANNFVENDVEIIRVRNDNDNFDEETKMKCYLVDYLNNSKVMEPLHQRLKGELMDNLPTNSSITIHKSKVQRKHLSLARDDNVVVRRANKEVTKENCEVDYDNDYDDDDDDNDRTDDISSLLSPEVSLRELSEVQITPKVSNNSKLNVNNLETSHKKDDVHNDDADADDDDDCIILPETTDIVTIHDESDSDREITGSYIPSTTILRKKKRTATKPASQSKRSVQLQTKAKKTLEKPKRKIIRRLKKINVKPGQNTPVIRIIQDRNVQYFKGKPIYKLKNLNTDRPIITKAIDASTNVTMTTNSSSSSTIITETMDISTMAGSTIITKAIDTTINVSSTGSTSTNVVSMKKAKIDLDPQLHVRLRSQLSQKLGSGSIFNSDVVNKIARAISECTNN